MELLVELYIAGFVTVLFYGLSTQLPEVRALRWWWCAWLAGAATLILDLLDSTQSVTPLAVLLLALVLLSGAAQMYLVARGLLCIQHSVRVWTYASVYAGFCLLLALVLLAVFGSSDPAVNWQSAARHAVMPLICGILFVHALNRGQQPDQKGRPTLLSAVLATGLAAGVLHTFLDLRLFEVSATLVRVVTFGADAGQIVCQLTCGLAMAYIAVADVRARDSAMRSSFQRLSALVDSTTCGICQVDADGQLAFVNPAASAMGAVAGNQTGLTLAELFGPQHDPAAAKTVTEFVLRPTALVRNAKAEIHRADGSTVSAEWSSSPLLRQGHLTGSVLTLADVTRRETAERFLLLRGQLMEMIARNKPVEEVSQALAVAVEERLPGFCCTVLVCQSESFTVAAAPSLPAVFRSAMNELPSSRFLPGGVQRDWEDRLRAIAPKYGYPGTWLEPMVSTANEMLGAVVLSHADIRPLSAEQAHSLTEAARIGALAIERHLAFERLLHQGQHDPLTGLPNRLLLADRLKQTLARATRTRRQLALMCIDLDRFKHVNDSLGHDVGDLFLQQISVRLASRIRSSDTLARTGGDEFTAILADIRDRSDAERVAESLIATLHDPFEVDGHTLYGAASIGIAVYPQDGQDAETLQRNADRAMYRAKAQGNNNIQSYSSDDAGDGTDRMEIELHLHRAIEQGNFTLEYQPQFTCNGRLLGFEALLRFRHPKLGMIPPTRFIPMAEESGLILPIGEWVLHQACRQLAEWHEKGMRPVRVAVNVSPLQFARADFATIVARALQASGVKPSLLELEVTEGIVMSSVHGSGRQMHAIANLGVRLSVDDFGTGYSSLSYLHQLPIQVLKIDRSFIGNITEPAGTRAIVEAIISLAHGLGLETVAEGVETEQQLGILQSAGCDLIQGYLFSRSLSAVDASCLLWQHTINGQLYRHPTRMDPSGDQDFEPLYRVNAPLHESLPFASGAKPVGNR